jgi:hypothetical protein
MKETDWKPTVAAAAKPHAATQYNPEMHAQ